MSQLTITNEMMLAFIPIILVHLSLVLIALYDLHKQVNLEDRYKWFRKIVLVSWFGPIYYFLKAPREDRKFLQE